MRWFHGVEVDAARAFADRWLPAWTGNNPEKLLRFYAVDAVYIDPEIRDGVFGHPQLLQYFDELLAQNPNWLWVLRRATPMQGGFVTTFEAAIPTRARMCRVSGVSLVWLNSNELITRNEVYFDRSSIVQELDT